MEAPVSRRFRTWAVAGVPIGAALLILAAAWAWRADLSGASGFRGFSGVPGRSAPSAETGLTLPGVLGEGGEGFRKVTGPRPFRFPEDHGPHPDFRSEWWYFTGNLKDTEGREYGYQLTFFRSGLRPPAPADTGSTGAAPGRERPPAASRGGDGPSSAPADGGARSPWAARAAYMAHFALTEATAGRFHAHERFSRASLGLAGAETGPGRPFRVWLEDWSAVSEAPPGDTALFPLRLRASQGGVSLDLLLRADKSLVLQGDSGFSRKGPEAGNASHYYSYTRLSGRGQVTLPGGAAEVAGTGWMDREWGSSLLSPGLAGWEWFALQLPDSTDWLFFRLRKEGAGAAAEDSVRFDYGLKVDARGRSTVLGPADLSARILSRWTSPRGRTYPARWRLSVPSESLEMEVAPVLAAQELDLAIPYWEGAVRVEARRDLQIQIGQGYMELTGYGQ